MLRVVNTKLSFFKNYRKSKTIAKKTSENEKIHMTPELENVVIAYGLTPAQFIKYNYSKTNYSKMIDYIYDLLGQPTQNGVAKAIDLLSQVEEQEFLTYLKNSTKNTDKLLYAYFASRKDWDEATIDFVSSHIAFQNSTDKTESKEMKISESKPENLNLNLINLLQALQNKLNPDRKSFSHPPCDSFFDPKMDSSSLHLNLRGCQNIFCIFRNDCKEINLREADFESVVIFGDMSHVNFTKAVVRGHISESSTMTAADFSYADVTLLAGFSSDKFSLNHTQLTHDLTFTYFNEATYWGSDFRLIKSTNLFFTYVLGVDIRYSNTTYEQDIVFRRGLLDWAIFNPKRPLAIYINQDRLLRKYLKSTYSYKKITLIKEKIYKQTIDSLFINIDIIKEILFLIGPLHRPEERMNRINQVLLESTLSASCKKYQTALTKELNLIKKELNSLIVPPKALTIPKEILEQKDEIAVVRFHL